MLRKDKRAFIFRKSVVYYRRVRFHEDNKK